MSYATIGQALREWREAAGLTQVQAATASGYTQTTISSWETGRTSPRMEQVGTLATLYNVSAGVAGEALLGLRRESCSEAPQ